MSRNPTHDNPNNTTRQATMNAKEIKLEGHKARHVSLHHSLDELTADWIRHTGKRPSENTVLDLIEWSHKQTESPTEEV